MILCRICRPANNTLATIQRERNAINMVRTSTLRQYLTRFPNPKRFPYSQHRFSALLCVRFGAVAFAQRGEFVAVSRQFLRHRTNRARVWTQLIHQVRAAAKSMAER